MEGMGWRTPDGAAPADLPVGSDGTSRPEVIGAIPQLFPSNALAIRVLLQRDA
jgi:hypothetical protein